MERSRLKKSNLHDNIEVNHHDTDFKADVLAAGLIEQGVIADDILILRDASGRFNIQKEIAKVYNDSNKKTGASTVFKVNKRGIYDQMPEGLFHKTGFSGKDRSKENILNDIKRQRQEEFYVRNFFSLFESEIDRSRIMISLKELFFDKKNTHTNYIEVFTEYWPIIKKMNTHKAVLFLKIVPLIAKIRLQNSLMEQALSYLLEVPVTIANVAKPRKIEGLEIPKLGSMRLGQDSMLYATHEPNSTITQITLGPIPKNLLSNYLKGQYNYELLELLLLNFLPANADYEINYVANYENRMFELATSTKPVEMFLGINTFLTATKN